MDTKEKENDISDQKPSKRADKKVFFWVVLAFIILVIAAAGSWYLFIKKSAEGEACSSTTKCETGLTCENKVCSSGKAGSVCEDKDSCKTDYCVNGKCTEGNSGDNCSSKADCKTAFCVSSKCTDGKLSDACSTYKDCDSGLYCKQGACATPPDYTKYFSTIVISKMKPGMPPGTDNPTTVTNTFSSSNDAVEIDFRGVKTTTIGEYHIEIVDSITGEVARNTKEEMDTEFDGQDTGMGTDMNGVKSGTYDLNIYLMEELIFTTQIIISE